MKICICIKKQLWTNTSSKGLSLVEVLIAIGIISIVCIPVIQIVYSIQPKRILEIISNLHSDILDSSTHNTSLKVAYYNEGETKSEYVKGGLWNIFSNDSEIFTRQTCTDFHPVISQEQGFNSNSNIISPVQFLEPRLYLYTPEDLFMSTSTTVTGTAIIGNNIFLSANSASTTEPDLYMYSVTTSLYNRDGIFDSKPAVSLQKFQDTGPGISSLQIRGMYAISANTGVKSQVDIFRIQETSNTGVNINTNAIWNKDSYVIPGSNSSTTPLTKVVLYASGKIIVGTEKSVLPEIVIFDIASREVLATLETNYGINDMILIGHNLVVAGPRDPEIEIYNLETLQKVNQYDLLGGSGNAKVLGIFGDVLYVGRTKGGDEFVMLQIDIRDDFKLTPVFNTKIKWSVDTLLKYGEYTILTTADEYNEFQLYRGNVSPTLVSQIDLPSRVSSATCFKNSIWMSFKNPQDQLLSEQNPQPYVMGILVF